MLRESWARRSFCLVMSPDRADAIVGDLIEMSSTRGRAWFWRQALRAWVRYAFSTFKSAPVQSSTLAMGGLFIYSIVYWGLLELVNFQVYRDHIDPGNPIASVSMLPASALGKLAFIVAGASLATGLILGRFGTRPAMNGILPVFAIFFIYWLVWPVIGRLGFSLPWYIVLSGLVALPLIALLPLATGGAIGAAALQRR